MKASRIKYLESELLQIFYIYMETKKHIFNFCNAAVFYDYKNIGNIKELNQAHKCIINNFHRTTPVDRILLLLTTISFIDIEILKTHVNVIQNVIENVHVLREILLYMLSFEKVIREEAN